MKRPHNILAAAIFLLLAVPAKAMDVKVDTTTSANYLSASGEISEFTLPTGSIHGSGLRADFSHYFTDTMNFDAFLGSALNGQSAGSSSFTGLGGYFYYTVLGNCCSIKKTVSSGGMPIASETLARRNSFSLGLGLDQFFLNGTTAVYSVSGVGAGAKYQFSLFKYNFEAAARYSLMSAGGVSIKGIFFSAGMIFSL